MSEGVEEAKHSRGLMLGGSTAGARAVEHSVQVGDLQDMRLGGWQDPGLPGRVGRIYPACSGEPARPLSAWVWWGLVCGMKGHLSG